MSHLATRFSRNSNVFRSDAPLGEEQMRRVAPSIFAANAHASRSERYAYIPTIDVLRGLQNEGFQPFMVAQSKCRDAGRAEYTKHMIRMRHASSLSAKGEANEVILVNSHGGESSYQMLAGSFRFVCHNGLVCGDVAADIRIKHKGNAQDEVIEGAFRVLDDFEIVEESISEMKALSLNSDEQRAFAAAALELRYGDRNTEGQPPAPVTVEQLNQARRFEDRGDNLWLTFQRVQENSIKGGLPARTAQGRRVHTRAVGSIDRSVTLNRALWVLAEEMRKIKS